MSVIVEPFQGMERWDTQNTQIYFIIRKRSATEYENDF